MTKRRKDLEMKKLLILAGIAAMTCSTQVFAEDNAPQDKAVVCPAKVERPQCKELHKPKCDFNKFEDELGLTAKQKEQAKQLREKQMEAAKPIVEQLKQKEKEVQELRAQLRDLRVQGKKDFEAILTDKQLKKLEQMKAERKQNFDKHRKHHGHKRPMPIEK
ncbi:MAG: hypothetical protein NC408_06385 [Candidatus Gastranaerophilales bacterium]|nr:hypothetical protein [Candidatus Gastranaerophilales bacterium]MCM1073063.1 hypothetical protein [Bacteroides sp.]